MTVRTLVLLRHAKAETPLGVRDVDRPLADRGVADAAAAGTWLAHRRLHPDVVLCSPARRTRETWAAVAAALPDATPQVHYDRQLYAEGPDELLDLVRAQPDEVTTVLVVGHNPTISEASLHLAPDDTSGPVTGLKTAGIAVHRCRADWSALGPDTTDLVERHTARA